jgi:hypothetical protein
MKKLCIQADMTYLSPYIHLFNFTCTGSDNFYAHFLISVALLSDGNNTRSKINHHKFCASGNNGEFFIPVLTSLQQYLPTLAIKLANLTSLLPIESKTKLHFFFETFVKETTEEQAAMVA